MLTADLHLVLRLGISGALPLLSLYTFVPLTGTTLLFTFIFQIYKPLPPSVT